MSGVDRLTAIERHADTERNRILNTALTDLDAIINGHNPDGDTSINNMVWDRLDKLACDVELLAHRRASQAAPAPSDALREENDRLRAALEFYANPDNWIDTPNWDGPDTATPKAVPVMNDPHGSRPCDCGDTARAALSIPTEERQ